MNVSPDLSLSIKRMKPYFLFSAFFYLLSMLWLFFIKPHSALDNFQIVGWVHLYMLGFIMFAIFSAIAQLGAIVSETKHYHVNIFKYLWMLLIFGIIFTLLGFYADVVFLLFGGILVLIAMSIYSIEFLLTLKSAKRKTTITKAMKMSNLFLLLGVISGIAMAFGLNGILNINPHSILLAHTFGLVIGFVLLLIMGISIILIPMFGSAKRISDNEFSGSFYTLSFGVMIMMLSPLFATPYLKNIAYAVTIIATLLYLYQLFKMTASRAKIIYDIWTKSMYVGFSSFIIAFILLLFFLLSENELILKLGMWILFIGFFGFIVIGNFYKIIPFLVWFQIYAPLIEERTVPMLHEIIPEKSTNMQWFFSTCGLLLSSVGIASQNLYFYYSGVTLLAVGALIFIITINIILKTKL